MTKNNKSRSLVNIIGIPLIVTSILVGNFVFTLFISTVIILGTKEYINLVKRHSIEPSIKLLYIGQIFLIISSLYFTSITTIGMNYEFLQSGGYYILFNTLGAVMKFQLCLPILFVLISMIVEVFKKSSRPLLNISTTLFGFIWIGVFINSLVRRYNS